MAKVNIHQSAPKNTVSADTQTSKQEVYVNYSLPFEPKTLDIVRKALGLRETTEPNDIFVELILNKDVCPRPMLKEMFRLDNSYYFRRVFFEGKRKYRAVRRDSISDEPCEYAWKDTPDEALAELAEFLEAGIARTVLQVKVDLSRMSEDGKEMFDAQGLIYDSQMGNYQSGCNAWRVYVRCSDEYDCNPLERHAVESVAWSLMYRAAARLPEDVLKQLYKRFADEGFEYGYSAAKTKLSDMVAEPLMDYLRAMALDEKEY